MQDDRFAELLSALATTLERFAGELTPAQPEQPTAVQPPRPADEHALGRRQQQIVELTGLATEDGLKTAAVAAEIDYEVPNTYSALQALARSQVVEQVPGKEPQHWRLVRRYRATSQAFVTMADHIRPGEWTTATDISIAVRGDVHATGELLKARLSHRILADATPDAEVRTILAAEGLPFDPDGNADPSRRLTWDALVRRDTESRTRRQMMSKATLNYLEIPATDLEESATFYAEVFGWQVTHQPTMGGSREQTGYPTFVDASGNVGGAFVLSRTPSREAGFLPSVNVGSIDEVLTAVRRHGGEVVTPRTPIVAGTDWEATFRDPAGNLLALYESAAG